VKRKINCLCENIFEVDVPEEIDLDLHPKYLDEILQGSFFSFVCKFCGKKHKPEFSLIINWPGKKARFEVFPESERAAVYRDLQSKAKATPEKPETIIGYPEMADRIAVLNDGLDPVIIETIKYYLHLKAEEENQDKEINIWYYGCNADQNILEFQIFGIKENEILKIKIPFALYQKNLDEYKRKPKNKIYRALRNSSYLSVKNTMRPGPVSSRRD
jgi:hypothetical protein